MVQYNIAMAANRPWLKFRSFEFCANLCLSTVFTCALTGFVIGCDDEPGKNNREVDALIAGEMNGGESPAGESSAGELLAGESSAGESNQARNQFEAIEASRTINLPNLSAPVEVIFTEGMVPNIYAENEADLGRTLGYILARDRYFNMDLVRRLAQGRVSELFGDVGLSTDMESLGLGMGLVTERLEAHTSERSKAYLTAVAEGINAYVEAVRQGEEEAPSEFKLAAPLFGVQPIDLMQEWTATDIISMATSILYQTNFEDKDIAATERFLQLETIYGDDQARREAFIKDVALNMAPPVDGNSAVASPTWGENNPWQMNDMESQAGEQAGAQAGEQAEMAGASTGGMPEMMQAGNEPLPENKSETVSNTQSFFSLPTQTMITKQIGVERLKKLKVKLAQRHGWFGKDYEAGFGSNAWAAGQSATSAGSIVSGDGHLQLSVPSIMYQVGLNTDVLGGGEIKQKGLLIASIPVMAVGTNGKVAWSQVNPVVDITDWYVEKIQLNEAGLPVSSFFQGEWHELNTREESVNVAERVLLGSEAQTVTWQTYLTFDGRRIIEIEGRELGEDEELAEGESVITMLGTKVIPSDLDGDGEITAISFDYTAFDASGFVDALFNLGLAQNMDEFEEQTKRLIGGGLFSAAGDAQGSILYSSYQSIPCRSYLERDEAGTFLPGQSPMALLDGTQVGGFTILSDDQGYVDESQNSDPYKCAIPYDQMPLSRDPLQGFVATANNDPQGFADDGRVDNDAWYLGGPWAPFRQSTIKRALGKELDRGAITVASMQRIHANHDSRLGELFTPSLIELVEQLDAWSNDGLNDEHPSKQIALDTYNDHKIRIQEAVERLKVWRDGSYQAESGVETFYNTVDETEIKNAVATSIFNAYFRVLLKKVWDDEAESSIPYDGTRLKIYALDRMLRGRGADNPLRLASWSESEQESMFFDRLETTEHVERSEEIMVTALVEGLDKLSAETSEYGQGGFGSENMDNWLWGLHHMARFESLLGPFLGGGGPFGAILERFSITTAKLPLADDIPEGDPRAELKWFPKAGDQWNVDAANPGFGGGYTFSNGPVMRMTIQLNGEQVQGYNIIPGGQSGLEDDPHSADQLKLWLANEAYPLRYHLPEVLEGAMSRWQFSSASND